MSLTFKALKHNRKIYHVLVSNVINQENVVNIFAVNEPKEIETKHGALNRASVVQDFPFRRQDQGVESWASSTTERNSDSDWADFRDKTQVCLAS